MDEKEFDNFLRTKINQLETRPPELTLKLSNSWKEIEHGLSMDRRKTAIVFSMAIAASLSLLFILITYLPIVFSEEEITYRQVTEIRPAEFIDNMNERLVENQILAALEQKCKIKKAICMQEEYIQLKHELDKLNTKEKQIQKELQFFGEAPSVVKAQIKIKNIKADLLKRLIKF